jgi:ubiquitin-protein ligase E3 C
MRIPLLQYRLPLPSITHLSANLPLHNLHLVPDLGPQVLGSGTTLKQRCSLLALLVQLTAPRYTKLSTDALDTYLSLITSLINSIPINAFDPVVNAKQRVAEGFNFKEENQGVVDVASSFSLNTSSAIQPMPKLDSRTLKRLHKIPTPAHLSPLLEISLSHAREVGLSVKVKVNPDITISLSAFLLSLVLVCPREKATILQTICSNAPELLHELYHLYVHRSPVGKDMPPGSEQDHWKNAILDPNNSDIWAPLLLLCEVYSQRLDTMGDDEFFGTTNGKGSGRNPFTVDELADLTRQLLNIAFVLFMGGDGKRTSLLASNEDCEKDSNATDVDSLTPDASVSASDSTGTALSSVTTKSSIPSSQLRVGWEGLRDGITRCLLRIHARE